MTSAVREDPESFDSHPLSPEEKAVVAALVEDGLSIQDRFRPEPLYRDTGLERCLQPPIKDDQAANREDEMT